MRQPARFPMLVAVVVLTLAVGCEQPATRTNPAPASHVVAPDSFVVSFETSRGALLVSIHRDWAPHGVDRFYELVQRHYYDGARFFRVVPNFVAQFGLAADPALTALYKRSMIADDTARQQNVRGTLSFASSGKGTRTAQLFFNLVSNSPQLDAAYPPIGRIVQGLAVIDQFTAEYDGRMPDWVQDSLTQQGNGYLLRTFPKLDFIQTIRLVKQRK